MKFIFQMERGIDMAVCDLQKCIHIINKYGSHEQIEVADKLRSLTWDRFNMRKGTYEMLDVIVNSFLLDTANEIYANNKDNHNNEWFMLGHSE